ncbi:translation elongation factor Ts [Candidatus Cerribacteria bacterium 'Amazon FNV 2010 28 9']|uniref:Elongation factor Ts n=1 Tax=Candidatus Cerribacteria bacterium 'Amazon FNV 2010 28 9' TaxID=2081795 RepID=A0A317JPL4_9BACT|nr:MAG: translation elongation factor Ts [Candidatus Cerribacteria bacterium 'Amazon FNV 2010 28 9']
MAIDLTQLKALREETGAGVMDVRRALESSNGDVEKARAWIRENAIKTAEKKADRETKEGAIVTYIHNTGKVGAVVALTCETDFVARTDDFKTLGREVAMQVASMDPQSVDELLAQPYIRDAKTSIKDLIKQTSGKVGENIVVKEFKRLTI